MHNFLERRQLSCVLQNPIKNLSKIVFIQTTWIIKLLTVSSLVNQSFGLMRTSSFVVEISNIEEVQSCGVTKAWGERVHLEEGYK